MKFPAWLKTTAPAVILLLAAAPMATAEDAAKKFFFISGGDIIAYDSMGGGLVTLVKSGAVRKAILSRNKKTIFYSESRPGDYPGCAKRMKAEPIATRLYKLDLAENPKAVLLRGPAKTDLKPFLDSVPIDDLSLAWYLLGIKLWAVTEEDAVIFSQQRLYSCTSSGVVRQLDKGLDSMAYGGGAELLDAYIYEIIWTERYAAIAFCPAGMIEGYHQIIFVLKNGTLADTTGAEYSGYMASSMVRALRDDGTAFNIYSEPETNGERRKVLSLINIETGAAIYESEFVRSVPYRFIDGEAYTLDDPFSASPKPGLYMIGGQKNAVKLRDLPPLPFRPSEQYYWDWMYDREADCIYGTAAMGAGPVVFIYDFARGRLLTDIPGVDPSSFGFDYIRGVAVAGN
jgi:hypothetical protein